MLYLLSKFGEKLN